MKSIELQQHYGDFRFPACFFEFKELILRLQDVYGIDLRKSPLGIVPGEVFDETAENPFLQSRYPNDPPEFLTVLHGQSDGLHWGYYIQDENTPEIIVVSYYHRDQLRFSIDGLNLHEALRKHLEACWRDNLGYFETEKDDSYRLRLDQLAIIRNCIKEYDTSDRPEMGTEYLEKYQLAPKPGIPLRYGLTMPERTDFKLPESMVRLTGSAFIPNKSQVMEYQQLAKTLVQTQQAQLAWKLGSDLWCCEQYRSEATEILGDAYAALDRKRALGFLKLLNE
jgi:hypothetical protein